MCWRCVWFRSNTIKYDESERGLYSKIQLASVWMNKELLEPPGPSIGARGPGIVQVTYLHRASDTSTGTATRFPVRLHTRRTPVRTAWGCPSWGAHLSPCLRPVSVSSFVSNSWTSASQQAELGRGSVIQRRRVSLQDKDSCFDFTATRMSLWLDEKTCKDKIILMRRRSNDINTVSNNTEACCLLQVNTCSARMWITCHSSCWWNVIRIQLISPLCKK